jgi:hypothetical protein
VLDKIYNENMSKCGAYKLTEEIKIIKLIPYIMWKQWNVIDCRNES